MTRAGLIMLGGALAVSACASAPAERPIPNQPYYIESLCDTMGEFGEEMVLAKGVGRSEGEVIVSIMNGDASAHTKATMLNIIREAYRQPVPAGLVGQREVANKFSRQVYASCMRQRGGF